MLTRDSVQGFIDGHKAGGHSKDCLKECVSQWLKTHPLYPPAPDEYSRILDDLESYRT
jgi:hypothetical protein